MWPKRPGNERALSDIRFRRRVRRRRARQSGLCSLFRIFRTQGVCRRIDRLSARTARDGRKPPRPADTPEALAERFFAAVDMAVEDLYDATSFIVGQARAWGLDPSAVVASGSSAGAITVLQGEYERCTGSALSRRLPEGFRYAGIIAFAGAVLEKGPSGPVWREKARPDPAISRRCGL